MTIELRKEQKHLICSWIEPTKAVFQGKTVTIRRKKMRRLKVTPGGEIIPSELTKLGSHERTRAVHAELARMRRSGVLGA